jgi:hypothetical protein
MRQVDVAQLNVFTLAYILKIYLNCNFRKCDNKEFRVYKLGKKEM